MRNIYTRIFGEEFMNSPVEGTIEESKFMDKKIKELLLDCQDSFQYIVDCEYWQHIEECSGAEILINEIQEILDERC